MAKAMRAQSDRTIGTDRRPGAATASLKQRKERIVRTTTTGTLRKMVLAMTTAMVVAAALPARAANTVDVTVEFPFRVGTTDLPAGRYAMTVGWAERVVTLTDLESRRTVVARVVTALGPDAVRPDGGRARLVFGRAANGRPLLSKVWWSRSEGALIASQEETPVAVLVAASR